VFRKKLNIMRPVTTADVAKIFELLGIKDRYIRKATIHIEVNMPMCRNRDRAFDVYK